MVRSQRPLSQRRPPPAYQTGHLTLHSILYQPQPGFSKSLALSVMLHVIFLLFAVVVKVDTERTFYSPVYTVEIVTPPPAKVKKTPVAPAPVKKTVKKTPPPTAKAKEPAPVKTKGPVVKVAAPKVVEKKPDPSEAIKKIREGVLKKETAAEAEASIEAIRKKARSDTASVAALKEKIAEKKALMERLATVKEGISTTAKDKKATPLKTKVTEAPVEAAPAVVTVTKVRDEHRPYLDRVAMMINKQWSDLWSHLDVPKGEYKLLVSLKIARSGELLDTWIEKGSPDLLFNDSLIEAVKMADFPPLPETMEVEVFELGLRFCSGRCR